MKKNKSKIVIIVLLLISLVITVSPENASAAEGIEVKTSFGIDGSLKTNSSIPVQVEVENNLNQDFTGTVEILVPNQSGTKDSYGEEVEIKKGDTKTIVLPVNNIAKMDKVKIKLSQDDSTIFEKEVVVSSEEIQPYGKMTIGTFTEDKESLKYLNNFRNNNQKNSNNNYYLDSSKVLELSHDLLSSNYKNLQMIDMIVISKYDSLKFTENEISALNTWVKDGGILIIGGSERTLNPLNNKIIKASITTGTNTLVNLEEQELNLTLGKLTGEIGTKILSDGENILATRIKNETGSIILTSFDIGDKNFSEFANVNEVLTKILEADLIRVFGGQGNNSDYPYQLDNMLETVPLDEAISVSNVLILLIVFVVLVSFGSYFILKKINKRSYIWIVIPVLSVIVTFIMFTIGKETSLNGKILNSINIVNVDSEGNGEVSSYLSIGNKYKSSLKMEEPEGVKIEQLIKPNDMNGQISNNNNSSDKVAVKTIYNGDKTYYDFNEISALELKKFKIMGQEAKYKKLESSLNYIDSSLTGTFKNPYDTDIEKLYVVFGNNLFSTGQVKKGDTYKFDAQKSISQDGITGYTEQIQMEYYSTLGRDSNIDKDKFKGALRDINILSLIRSKASLKPYYIAITKDKIEFGINFGEEEISDYSQTTYVGNLEINLKDLEGNTVYPLGYITPEIESSESQGLALDPTSYIAWQSGEIIMKYNIGEKFTSKEIKIDTLPTTERMKNDKGDVKFKGSIKVYNIKTDKFDDVSYIAGTPLKLNNLDQYLSNGILRIKYIGNDEQGGRIPVIAVKGEVQK